MFDLDKKEYFVSRDVVFVENEYPFNKLSNCVHDDISSHSHGREVNVPDCLGDCARIDQELSGANDRGIGGANEAQAESCSHEKSSLDDTLEEFCVAHEEEHLG